MTDDRQSVFPDQPQSYEAATAAGFQPIKDIGAFMLEIGIDGPSLDIRRHEYRKTMRGDCSLDPQPSPCFDFCYSNGVRILAYCGPTKECDRYVHGSCKPY